ncbi:hypothetical protein B8A22_12305 [Staphylococcus aureus]|nr:hypothetical protein BZJ79_08640 [Staphylococcus aureus]ORN47146.1 hypothetical protein B8A22_12305 [Staphylococcus aureus]ORT78727.1 hypothetical protein B6V77_06775 [Staphylococcus aureus]PTY47233.1 hypothetical protein B1T33_04235 [Staphylococcus aureus]PTY50195.1 hypothetical protein B1T34_00470 [Staphylococcus aureus]
MIFSQNLFRCPRVSHVNYRRKYKKYFIYV